MTNQIDSCAANLDPGRRIDVPTQYMDMNVDVFRRSFDREPFGFTHGLSGLDLFRDDALHGLCDKFERSPRDYAVAGSAPTPGTRFGDVPGGGVTPAEALQQLNKVRRRILLKRPEKHDTGFRDLLHVLFKQVVDLKGGLGRERVVRLESAILISSGSTTTPVHFDPEIGFFSQIEGEKFYHVYSPVSTPEEALERFYIRGRIQIGNVDLAKLEPGHEQVFVLGPGKGFHQPQNSPHWVQTGNSRSVSYTFVFETDVSRALGRTRAFNHCLRTRGFSPSPTGAHPSADAAKAFVMYGAKPFQQAKRAWDKGRRVLRGWRLRSHSTRSVS